LFSGEWALLALEKILYFVTIKISEVLEPSDS